MSEHSMSYAMGVGFGVFIAIVILMIFKKLNLTKKPEYDERQLYEQGINRIGVKLSDFAPYSETTVMLKRIKGDPYDRVTLRDDGDFHGEWKVEADDKGFKLTTSDWKEELLGRHYGKEIYGLTEENAQEFTTEYIKPDLLRITREILLS